jgi:phage gpG-like protein
VALFDARIDSRDVERVLEDFEENAQDLSETMAVVSELLVAAVSDRYESQGGGEWPGLADATIAKRRKGEGGTKILQDTGAMAGSTEASHGSDWAQAATGVEYALHHVFGAPKANIPKRNPFEIDERYFDEAAELIVLGVLGS